MILRIYYQDGSKLVKYVEDVRISAAMDDGSRAITVSTGYGEEIDCVPPAAPGSDIHVLSDDGTEEISHQIVYHPE